MSDRRLPSALSAAVAERVRPERLGAAAARLSAGYRAHLSSRHAVPDAAGVAAYAASKAAVAGFTASLALELEAFAVRVKLVEP